MLGKANGKQIKWIPHGSSNYISINYEVNELLDFGGEKCNNHKEYNKDLCTHKAIEEESLETIGCTTPFGPGISIEQIEQTLSKPWCKIAYHDQGTQVLGPKLWYFLMKPNL